MAVSFRRIHIVGPVTVLLSIFLTAAQPVLAGQRCADVFSSQKSPPQLASLLARQPYSLPNRIARGYSMPGHGGRELLRMILGDRNYELKSWALQQATQERLGRGEVQEAASENAHLDVMKEIVSVIESNGFPEFYRRQMKDSYVGLDQTQKKAAVLFAGPMSNSDAFGYARFALWKRAADANYPRDFQARAVVLEIDPREVPTIAERENFEYMVLSRLDARAISAAYLGFPRYSGESFTPRGIQYDWFYFKVNRADSGDVSSIEVYEATERGVFGLQAHLDGGILAVIAPNQSINLIHPNPTPALLALIAEIHL